MALSGRLSVTSWQTISCWSLLAVVWTFPINALALEPVRYRCGALGEVIIDFLWQIQQAWLLFTAINVGQAPLVEDR
jgi:hypothetical protein